MGARLIAYECVAAGHQPSLVHPDKLTVHEGNWAFCCFDAFADGHQWKQTGGIELQELMRRAGLSVGPAPRRTDVAEAKPSSVR